MIPSPATATTTHTPDAQMLTLQCSVFRYLGDLADKYGMTTEDLTRGRQHLTIIDAWKRVEAAHADPASTYQHCYDLYRNSFTTAWKTWIELQARKQQQTRTNEQRGAA